MPRQQALNQIVLTRCQRKHLKRLRRQHQLPQCLGWRINIILKAGKRHSNRRIAQQVHKDRKTVQLWRARWVAASARLQVADAEGYTQREWGTLLRALLSDAPRSGAPGKYSAEQLTRILAVACERPAASGRPVTHWTPRELAAEVIKRCIVTTISPRTVGRLLHTVDLKPHRSRYWLTAAARIANPAQFENAVRRVCALYASAATLHKLGVHVISVDEKTSIQALERKYAPLPMRPGQVERREFEYIRHGTQCLIANFEVATGQCILPTIQATRTEADFVQHITRLVAQDPTGEWVFIADQLNTHVSASLVRWIATQCGITSDLGTKGKTGILKSRATRRAFLEAPCHRIRFVYTPKHASWLNQVEIWFSILVRRVLKRGSFISIADLRQQLLDFIAYFNHVLAKPFQWTYAGKPLCA